MKQGANLTLNSTFLGVVFSVLVFALTGSAVGAQVDANQEQGFNQYGSYDFQDVDTVSMTNGNLLLHVPLVSYPQRGGKLKLDFSLMYERPVWNVISMTTSAGQQEYWAYQNNRDIQVVQDDVVSLVSMWLTRPRL